MKTIKYESIVTKKDTSYIVKKKVFLDPILFYSRLIFSVVGFALMGYSIYRFVTADNLAFNISLLVVGVYLSLFDPVVNHKLKVNVQHKNSMNELMHYITVDDKTISVTVRDRKNTSKDFKSSYSYRYVNKAFLNDDTLYIHIKNSKIFIVFHKEDFTEGSLEDLITLLKSKNIEVK